MQQLPIFSFRGYITKTNQYFYQNRQYLKSFIERFLRYETDGRGHETYLEHDLEEYLDACLNVRDPNERLIFEHDIVRQVDKSSCEGCGLTHKTERFGVVAFDRDCMGWCVADPFEFLRHDGTWMMTGGDKQTLYPSPNWEVIGSARTDWNLLVNVAFNKNYDHDRDKETVITSCPASFDVSFLHSTGQTPTGQHNLSLYKAAEPLSVDKEEEGQADGDDTNGSV